MDELESDLMELDLYILYWMCRPNRILREIEVDQDSFDPRLKKLTGRPAIEDSIHS